MTPPQPIAVTVLTGPRGAGKTRLLNTVLGQPALAGTLALANEQGTTSLDPAFAAPADDNTLGCLCCAARDRLAGLLENLLRQLDNGRIAPFQRLVIETAGEADPAAIAGALAGHPYLSRRYGRPNVLLLAGNGDAATLARQAAAADAVILPAGTEPDGLAAAGPDVPRFDLADVHRDGAAAFLVTARPYSARDGTARRAHYRSALTGRA